MNRKLKETWENVENSWAGYPLGILCAVGIVLAFLIGAIVISSIFEWLFGGVLFD